MKLINIIVTAILIKNVMHELVISIWYAFSKLFDTLIRLLATVLIKSIKE